MHNLVKYPSILFCSFLLPKLLLLPAHLFPHAANDAFYLPVQCQQEQDGMHCHEHARRAEQLFKMGLFWEVCLAMGQYICEEGVAG